MRSMVAFGVVLAAAATAEAQEPWKGFSEEGKGASSIAVDPAVLTRK